MFLGVFDADSSVHSRKSTSSNPLLYNFANGVLAPRRSPVSNTTMHSERQHPRYEVQTRCLVFTEDGERLLGERSLDLSWNGVRVTSREPARVGEKVRVRLQVPKSDVWIDANGYVARILPARRRGEGEPSIGVQITRMDGMMRLLLASSVRARSRTQHTPRGPARDYAEIVRRIGS